MNASSPSFAVQTHFLLMVRGCRNAFLTSPALDADGSSLESKDLLSSGPVSTAGKGTLEEHLRQLAASGAVGDDRPLLALGLRNSLVNQRCTVIVNGRVFAADGERPEDSARPYYGISWRQGRFFAVELLPSRRQVESTGLFFSGVPVLWEGLSGEALFDRLLTEASDHSHVFDIPRGNHPQATDESRRTWSTLQQVFLDHLHADGTTAARAMRETVGSLGHALERCDSYLHSLLGVDRGGRLVNLVAHGRLERLGAIVGEAGCTHAICVENSGSIMPTALLKGLGGGAVPLLRAPNFRPKGRVLLLLELENGSFTSLGEARPEAQSSAGLRPEK